MRLRWALGPIVLGVAGLACVDLFHGTGDLRTDCELDPTTCPAADGGGDARGDGGVTALCTSDRAAAEKRASRACALLGGCELPFGGSELRACMVRALQVFDCNASPQQPVRGAAREHWACVDGAKDCAALAACIQPAGQQSCTGRFVKCGYETGRTPTNAAARIDCAAGRSAGESCLAWGRTCVEPASGGARCAPGGDPSACADAGASEWCSGTVLHACSGGEDLGVDCASFGAGECVAGANGATCRPVPGGECTPIAAARCNGNVAIGCKTGVEERVDCERLHAVCRAGIYPGRLEGACVPPNTACPIPQACSAAGTLTACKGGQDFGVDCASVGMSGACAMADTAEGPQAACTP